MSEDPQDAYFAGEKPKLGWLPVDRLSVDHFYQRSLQTIGSKRLIIRLIADFNWAAFQAIVVTEADDGWLIIDGQHRVEAAKQLGETHVPAVIIEALSSDAQARIFVSANRNRVPVNPIDMHIAELAAGDRLAHSIEELCENCNIRIPERMKKSSDLEHGETLALNVLRQIARQKSDHAGIAALCLLRDAWSQPGGLTAQFIRATRKVLSLFPGQRDQLLSLLSGMPLDEWQDEYRGSPWTELADDLILKMGADEKPAPPKQPEIPQKQKAPPSAPSKMKPPDKAKLMAGR